MSNNDRLNEALKNVAFCADSTWSNGDYDPFQKANLNLHLTSRHVKVNSSKWSKLTPRTVRDSIPQSKLAKYGNYEYDEARELSYTPNVVKYERLYENFDKEEIVDEPWMLEEIDDLVAGFLTYSTNEDNICHKNKHETLPCSKDLCEKSYQSPFVEATTFDEMVLKLQLTSPYIKKLWDPIYYPSYHSKYASQTKNRILIRSPACRMFSSVKMEIEDSDWLRGEVESETLLEKFNNRESIFLKNYPLPSLSPPKDDLSPNKRLYSAVLQGGSSNPHPQNELQMSSINFEFPPLKSTKNSEVKIREWPNLGDKNRESPKRTEMSTETCDTNWYPKERKTTATTTALGNQKISTLPIGYANYQYFPQQNTNFVNPRLYSTNNYNTNLINFKQTSCFPLLLHNATVPYPHQLRNSLPNYRHNMMFPQIRPQLLVPTSALFLQPTVKPAINLLAQSPPVHAPPGYNSNFRSNIRFNNNNNNNIKPTTSTTRPSSNNNTSNGLTILDEQINPHLESIVIKSVNAVLDEPEPFVPVTGTPSDELEQQALEQYIPSSTNVFQELERQAAEQYETSENWKSPPKYLKITFGGCARVKLVRIKGAKDVLGVLYFIEYGH